MKQNNSIRMNYINSSYVCLADIFNHLLDNIVLIIIAAILGAAFIDMMGNPVSSIYYSSTSKIYVTSNDRNISSLQNLSFADDLIGDYIAAFSNLEFHEMVIKELDLPYSPQELANMITVNNIDGTHILNITATVETTAEEAQLLAATYAEDSSAFFKEKFNIGEISVFEKATQPSTLYVVSGTVSPALGIFVGIILSCAFVILRAMFDDRIYTPEDITQILDVEVLGIISKQKRVCLSLRKK